LAKSGGSLGEQTAAGDNEEERGGVMIPIEKGIPIASKSGKEPSPYMVAMNSMEVGDSFLVPEGASLSQMYTYAKKLGIKFSSRTIVNGQRRIWRVA
jgi:hypothetical protein